MKKTFLFISLLLNIAGYSQITLDFQSSITSLIPVKLNESETKYLEEDIVLISSQNQFRLFNLDGSLYKTIQMPPKPSPSSWIYGIYYVSDSLFDNDPSNIEYIVFYNCDSVVAGSYHLMRVAREDGTILLSEPNASILQMDFDYIPVFNSEQGTKLILHYLYGNEHYYQTKVFSLPGKLFTANKNEPWDSQNTLSLYPNPNNGSFYIKIHSNNNNSQMIDLYSTDGKLIDSYKSTGNLTHINNLGLSEGIYLINSRFKGINSTTKMIIKK